MPFPIRDFVDTELRHVDVGQGHRIALATAGDARNPAVVVVHGGPGSGSRLRSPRLFDPARHFVVWIDQRGCARSRPRAGLRRNNTAELVRDMERVREHLGLQAWSVYGGSWGAALALAYAARHPQRVQALLLRGAYLTSRRDTERFFTRGRGRAPRAWRALMRAAGAARCDRLSQCCATVSLRGTIPQRRRLGLAWSRFESAMLGHDPRTARRSGRRRVGELMDKFSVQAHFLRHACWLGRDGLRRRLLALRDEAWPALALHGLRDRVCPASNLRTLQGWLPRLRTRLVDCGHLETEAPMLRALREGLRELLSVAPALGGETQPSSADSARSGGCGRTEAACTPARR